MKSAIIIPRNYLKNPVHFLALGFGSGLLPRAPGTFGTLAAIPVYWSLSHLSMAWYLAVVLLLSVAGVAICEYTSRKLNVHDHPGIVFDEIVGYLLTMVALPVDLGWMLAGFIAFRFFDIVKPWPISWLDKSVKGGFGIMVDDVLAALMAWLVLQFGYRFLL